MGYTRDDIIDLVVDHDVKFIRLQFTDLFGTLKNVAITVSQLEKALNNECMVDGASVEGFLHMEENDMYLKPDLDTFVIFPWRPQHGKVARFLCDLYTADGKPFTASPRYVLQRAVAKAKEMGYQLQVGPECEFFLFQTDDSGKPTLVPHDQATYFDLSPRDMGENTRREICLTLEDMGFEMENSHHEKAPGQNEVDFRYQDALQAADSIMTLKLVVKTVAQRNGLFATFMPKPLNGTNGSGMHINLSLEKDGNNVFCDAQDPRGLGLSQLAYQFMAGVLAHMEGLTLLTNPTVNSYKRLRSGYEAPQAISWGITNRSPLIRIPNCKADNKHIELRSPDPTCNPYLSFAAILTAGLWGIEQKLDVPEMAEAALKAQSGLAPDLRALPRDLGEAMEAFAKDTLIRQTLGEALCEKYLEAKKREWDQYQTSVTDWERQQYFGAY